jgi:hypothetical protein
VRTVSAFKALWDGDKQFLSAIAKEVATLVAVPENMNYFRKQLTEFADKWTAYKTAYEADSKGKWQPSMGRPKNPLGTIWSGYGSGWKDGVENFLPDGPGIYLLRYYPCWDIKVILGACSLLAVIQDNVLPHCPPIAKDILPKKLSQEIWRNLITGVDVEWTLGQRSVIHRHKIAGFLIDVRADIGQDATALSGIEKIYFNKYSSAYKELWSRTKKNGDREKPELAKVADTNAEQKPPTSGGKTVQTGDNIQATSETTKPNAEPVRDLVFICYSHKDKRWLNDLQTHLKPYVRNGSMRAWSDKQIAPGSKWLPEIKAALASTKVAVHLVTPDFLASDFIHEHELTPLLKEAEKTKVSIIWIPVRACAYKETLLKDYQAVIDPEKPLANMKAERDKAWVKIGEEIKKAVSSAIKGNKKREASPQGRNPSENLSS